MSGASIKHAWVVWVACFAVSACGRIGFQEHALAPALNDAGTTDAGAPVDPGPPDSGAPADAGNADLEDAGPADAGTDAAQDDAATSCSTISSDDYCAELPHLDHVPLIDGRPECGLKLRPFTPQGWIGIPTAPTIPSDQGTPRVAIAWHEQGIYIYLEIADASLLPAAADQDSWCGDAAEAYVDSDGTFSSVTTYDNPGAAQFIATPPTGSPNDVPRSDRFRDGDTATRRTWSTPNHATFMTDTGYGLEAFITATDLDLSAWTLKPGNKVGVDVSADVSLTLAAVKAGGTGDCGTRAGQFFLHSTTQNCTGKACAPYRNTSAWCTPTLR